MLWGNCWCLLKIMGYSSRQQLHTLGLNKMVNILYLADLNTFSSMKIIVFLFQISLKFVLHDLIDNKSALVQDMAFCPTGSKPLPESMVTGSPRFTHMDSHLATSWWCYQMETFSALLAICAGNSRVHGEFPSQRPVTRSFDVFFDLRLNKRLSKQSWGWWFETLSSLLWCHSNVDGIKSIH